MTPAERERILRGRCPFCNSSDWYIGPQGGVATNIKCAKCGGGMNVGPGGFSEIIELPTKKYEEPSHPHKHKLWDRLPYWPIALFAILLWLFLEYAACGHNVH